jgi:hypothetical protein
MSSRKKAPLGEIYNVGPDSYIAVRTLRFPDEFTYMRGRSCKPYKLLRGSVPAKQSSLQQRARYRVGIELEAALIGMLVRRSEHEGVRIGPHLRHVGKQSDRFHA